MKKKEKKYVGKLPGTEIYKIEESERLIDCIKPNKLKFIFPHVFWFSLLALLIGALFITVGILAMLNIILTRNPNGFKLGILIFLVGVLVEVICIYSIIIRCFSYKNTTYYITNKRVLITYGLIRPETSCINLEFVVDAIVYSNIFDRVGKRKTASIALKCKRINKNDQSIFVLKHLDEASKIQNDIINLKNVLELEKIENDKK